MVEVEIEAPSAKEAYSKFRSLYPNCVLCTIDKLEVPLNLRI